MAEKLRVRDGGGEPERGPPAAHSNEELRKVEKIAIADIQLVGEHRDPDQAVVQHIAESIPVIGLQNPITVRRTEKIRDGVSTVAIELVVGRQRLEATKSLGLTQIDAFIMTGDDIEVRLVQIAENLHRRDLPAQERAELVNEWAELIRQRAKAGQLAHPGGQQPHDRGISGASKALGLTREEVRRSKAIAGISAQARAEAELLGVKDQSALLKIAKQEGAAAQVAKVQEIAARKARLRGQAHKKGKAKTEQAAPKSSAKGKPADTTTPQAADSPATMPEAGSDDDGAAEIERLKAELAEKTETLREIENELRQARIAASRASKGEVTSPSSVPTHGDDDLDIPAYLDRRPLFAEEEKLLAALLAVWANAHELHGLLAAASAIARARFIAAILRAVTDEHDSSVGTKP